MLPAFLLNHTSLDRASRRAVALGRPLMTASNPETLKPQNTEMHVQTMYAEI